MKLKQIKQFYFLAKYGLVFAISIYIGINFFSKQENISYVNDPKVSVSTLKINSIKAETLQSFSFAYNGTHLWSMHLADEEYYRIANMTSCRTVTYTPFNTTTGPKAENMNFCDPAVRKEFSIESTLHMQQWLYEHQHPANCAEKKFAIIHQYARSGFGSTVHQILWAFATALGANRIAVYETPGHWLYGNCEFGNPDCLFLPISNCSVPKTIDGDRVIRIKADIDHWYTPVFPPLFQNRSFNWYRSQLIFYLMRYNPETLAYVENIVAQNFNPPSIEYHRPFIALYVRRSDKVHTEMSRAYSIRQYFKLFHDDASKSKIQRVFLNSEDASVFSEFELFNKNQTNYYKLLKINVTRDIVYSKLISLQPNDRRKVILEFLSDLFIEANANLHGGTLTSNWCRLVDEIRFALGKTIAYYTPENRFIIDV